MRCRAHIGAHTPQHFPQVSQPPFCQVMKSVKGKRSQGGKGGTGSKSSKGNQGSSKGSNGSPDGGLSPSAAESEPAYRGVSEKEGAWRLAPLPEDRVLKVLVPFLGNALGGHSRLH